MPSFNSSKLLFSSSAERYEIKEIFFLRIVGLSGGTRTFDHGSPDLELLCFFLSLDIFVNSTMLQYSQLINE